MTATIIPTAHDTAAFADRNILTDELAHRILIGQLPLTVLDPHLRIDQVGSCVIDNDAGLVYVEIWCDTTTDLRDHLPHTLTASMPITAEQLADSPEQLHDALVSRHRQLRYEQDGTCLRHGLTPIRLSPKASLRELTHAITWI